MRIEQFGYSADNLAYLVHGEASAVAVDGGAVDSILRFLDGRGLELSTVTNTHSHADHTCGNRILLERTGARFIPAADLSEQGSLRLEDEVLTVIPTPGHTVDSLCLLGEGFVITGDTLLNGKVGRCFTGDYGTFFRSIGRLLELPDDTMIYGGHDYVEEYMEFAGKLEPDNPHIDSYLEMYRRNGVGADLSWEKRVDPFLRLDEPGIADYLALRGMPAEDRFRRFLSLFEV